MAQLPQSWRLSQELRLDLDLIPLIQQERPVYFDLEDSYEEGWAVLRRAGSVQIGAVWL